MHSDAFVRFIMVPTMAFVATIIIVRAFVIPRKIRQSLELYAASAGLKIHSIDKLKTSDYFTLWAHGEDANEYVKVTYSDQNHDYSEGYFGMGVFSRKLKNAKVWPITGPNEYF